MTKELFAILMTAILTQNFVLAKFLGICPFLGVSKKLNTAVGMSAAVIFVMALATAVCYPLNKFLLAKFDLEYLQTIVFILVIAALVQLVEIILKKYIPALYSALGIYLPLITTNCAVLGVVILNVDEGYNFAQSMFNSVGAGLGFMLVCHNAESNKSVLDYEGVAFCVVFECHFNICGKVCTFFNIVTVTADEAAYSLVTADNLKTVTEHLCGKNLHCCVFKVCIHIVSLNACCINLFKEIN